MKYSVLTLFPQMLDPLNFSIIKKAQDKSLLELEIVDFRKYSNLKWNRVDDYVYGGGPGLLIKPEPIIQAIKDVKTKDSRVILMTPEGRQFNNKIAKELSQEKHLIFVCGHYEGFDARVNKYIDDEISIGDYVLTSGEISATVCIDSISRYLPGVLGNKVSYEDDSFENRNLLDYDKYTKPFEYEGDKVPEVLISGHHKNIEKWRFENQIRKTIAKRSDLIDLKDFNKEEKKIIEEVWNEFKKS